MRGDVAPSLAQRRLTEDGIQAVLAAAGRAGLLGPDRTYDTPPIPDAGQTTFTVNANGSTHTVRVVGMGDRLEALAFANIWWGLLNLIPVLPWDGGHILEHALGPRRVRLTILFSRPKRFRSFSPPSRRAKRPCCSTWGRSQAVT